MNIFSSATNTIDFSQPLYVLKDIFRESQINDGFVQIKNIPNGLIEDLNNVQSQMINFFSQSIDDKMKLGVSRAWQFGYIPLNYESTNGISDTRETFSIGLYP